MHIAIYPLRGFDACFQLLVPSYSVTSSYPADDFSCVVRLLLPVWPGAQ